MTDNKNKEKRKKISSSFSLTNCLKPNGIKDNLYINVSAFKKLKKAVDQPIPIILINSWVLLILTNIKGFELGTFGFQANVLPLNYWPAAIR